MEMGSSSRFHDTPRLEGRARTGVVFRAAFLCHPERSRGTPDLSWCRGASTSPRARGAELLLMPASLKFIRRVPRSRRGRGAPADVEKNSGSLGYARDDEM